jgi:hypothetical protein
MTRILSKLLGAHEPEFQLSLRRLEHTNSSPSADILLTTEILQQVQDKIRQLGLDPIDTTPEELYESLQQRLINDDHQLRLKLNLSNTANPSEIMAALKKFIEQLHFPKSCFALRLAVAKKLLKATPPTKAMQALGYRSCDSMLKHEVVAQIYTAAFIYESSEWQAKFLNQYKKLQPSNFETRKITLYYPQSRAWKKIAAEFVADNKQTSKVFQELGAIIVMPTTVDLPAFAITNTLFVIECINDIRRCSAFLKLQQVKTNFGDLVSQYAHKEPLTSSIIFGRTLPWRVIHYYYDKHGLNDHPETFEPHVQAEDLQLARAETSLAQALPELEFWQDTAGLGLVKNDQPVSLNMLDVAVSVANKLPFGQRILGYMRDRMWCELFSRYLSQENLELALHHFSGELAEEPAMASIEEG